MTRSPIFRRTVAANADTLLPSGTLRAYTVMPLNARNKSDLAALRHKQSRLFFLFYQKEKCELI